MINKNLSIKCKIILISPLLWLSTCVFPQDNCKSKEYLIDSIMKTHIIPYGKKPVYNFLIYTNNYSSGCEIKKGVGTVGRIEKHVESDYQFKAASITKTMVATIILQLEEEGRLKISDYIGDYLKKFDFLRFSEIHYYKNVPYANSITIEMLLNHTSGIADIFTDEATRFNLSVLLHKKRQYTPQKVIEKYYKYNLNKKAFNVPGSGYHYSDINYMLLGFIIEKITNKELHEVIRERIIAPLNLNNTYFEYYEPAHGNSKQIDAFLNKINITEKINTSYEWAGGGIVSTTQDLAIFITALFNGKLFADHSTLDKMTDVSGTKKFAANYGLGIIRYEVDKTVFYGHGGFYGSILLYDPLNHFVLCANIGQASPPYDSGELAKKIIRIMLN
jgi:D-alanyl-D-alanine carboxypeptidase